MPGSKPDTNEKTVVFALGSTIYHIMKGRDSLPELEDEENIECRWNPHKVLSVEHGKAVVWKCWDGMYKSTISELQYFLVTFSISASNVKYDKLTNRQYSFY